MRSRLGITLGGAALAGIAGATLAAWQAGPPTAVRLITPDGALGGGLLGSSGSSGSQAALAPGWLLLRPLSDQSAAHAPAAPAAPVPATLTEPARSEGPATAILTAFRIHPPVPLSLVSSKLPAVIPVVRRRSSHGNRKVASHRVVYYSGHSSSGM